MGQQQLAVLSKVPVSYDHYGKVMNAAWSGRQLVFISHLGKIVNIVS